MMARKTLLTCSTRRTYFAKGVPSATEALTSDYVSLLLKWDCPQANFRISIEAHG